jgi:hypothetical protein
MRTHLITLLGIFSIFCKAQAFKSSDIASSEEPKSAELARMNNFHAVLAIPPKDIETKVILNLPKGCEESLIKEYQARKKASDKRNIVIALAYNGTEKSVLLLKNALTNEYAGKRISKEDEEALIWVTHAVGILSQKEESAFLFLKQAINSDYWRKVPKWKCSSEAYIGAVLTALSIQALGISGRPEVDAMLSDLRKTALVYRDKNDPKFKYGLDSAVCDAAFKNYVVRNYGIDRFRALYRTEGMDKMWISWKQTEHGKQWLDWIYKRTHGDKKNRAMQLKTIQCGAQS